MMDRTVGTCSICGGAVTLPTQWMSTVPPIPTCRDCGATAKPHHGGVIDMEGGRSALSEAAADRHERLGQGRARRAGQAAGRVEGVDK